MKMKRFMSFLAAGTVAIASIGLAGCSKEVPTDVNVIESKNDESVAEAEGVQPEEGAELLLWTDKLVYGEAIAEGFMALYPDVKVVAEEVGFTDARTKMELDGPAGSGADVFMISHNRLVSALAAGMVLKFEDSIAEQLREELSDVAISTASSGGDLYGVPVSTEANCLFYNKDIVGDKPAETFEEIFEFAREYNDVANNQFGFMMDVANAYSSYGFLTAYGYELFGADGTDRDSNGLESEAFIKGLEFIQSIREILPVQSQDLKGEFVNEQFKAGKTAYIMGGVWNIKDFTEAGVNFGVIQLPTIEGNDVIPFAGLKVAHVSAYSDYPIASMLLAAYMVSEEGANILYETNYKPTARADISTIEGLVNDESLYVFAQQFANANPVPGIDRMDYYYSIVEKVMALVFDGQLEPEEAAQVGIDEWSSMIASE